MADLDHFRLVLKESANRLGTQLPELAQILDGIVLFQTAGHEFLVSNSILLIRSTAHEANFRTELLFGQIAMRALSVSQGARVEISASVRRISII